MAEKGEQQNYGGCGQPSGHRDHMCVLMDRGQTAEIRRLSQHPAYVCKNCGAQAEEADSLCNPEPL